MSALDDLIHRVTEIYDLAGTCARRTAIPGVRLIHQVDHVPRAPLLYTSGIFVLLRGRKTGYLGTHVFEYDSENYLTVGLPLAMECETFASAEDPLLAIYIEVDPRVVLSVARAIELDIPEPAPDEVAVRATPLTDDMLRAVQRLLETLCSEDDMAILGEAALREVIYRALQGPAAGALRHLLVSDNATARIAQVMETLHLRFADRISVDEMAEIASMSPSAFYRSFREVAAESPLQYLKKVRLTQAAALIAHQNYRVSTAATAVGYESAAQFSRDFKTHFGISPNDARKLGYAFIRAELTS